MTTLDDAIRFLIDFALRPRGSQYSSYGYEIYLPNVINTFLAEASGRRAPGNSANEPEGRAVSPIFYEAAWELCRRGILRPGLKQYGEQATSDGASGSGYCLTGAGRAWLERADGFALMPMEPSRFARIIEGFRDRFGSGYLQRAQEAVRCHFATAYLASCAMSGAAAESILLRVAIAKKGSEDSVLRSYKSANGRRTVENMVIGQAKEPLASQFRNLMDLLKYWRDEAAHGEASDISEFEAYEAMARLLRLAHFVDDHWDELTRP